MRTKIWKYSEYGEDNPVEVMEQEVIDTYYTSWKERMLSKGITERLSEDDFLDEWIVVNWAWSDDNAN